MSANKENDHPHFFDVFWAVYMIVILFSFSLRVISAEPAIIFQLVGIGFIIMNQGSKIE